MEKILILNLTILFRYLSFLFYQDCIAEAQAGSHDLEIKRGRYVSTKLNLDERLCMPCHVIGDGDEDEHFVSGCIDNLYMHESLFIKLQWKNPRLRTCPIDKKIINLMSCDDRQILAWFGKLFHNSFQTRNSVQLIHSLQSCFPSMHSFCVLISLHVYFNCMYQFHPYISYIDTCIIDFRKF